MQNQRRLLGVSENLKTLAKHSRPRLRLESSTHLSKMNPCYRMTSQKFPSHQPKRILI